jgi:hypothetical protein
MSYSKIYKTLNENGKIDEIIAAASQSGIFVNEAKLLIIDAIEYLVSFQKSSMFKDCKYWTEIETLQKSIMSLVMVEYGKIMSKQLIEKSKCYDYMVNVHAEKASKLFGNQ